ncbi:unknown [Firmicutes bacterium CAG:882]|jgi:hypothetical protein|nr:unknown [Firmicutes bacterium CAG:882]
MKREEARQNLIALGIDEPTEAQITNYLNQFHNNTPQQPQTPSQPNNQQAVTPETKPDNSEELTQLREQIANLQRENIQKDIKAYAAEKGLTGEPANKVLAGFQDNLELARSAIDSVSEIITARETAAVQAKIQEIAKNADVPGGGGAGSQNKEKPNDVANAETISFGSAAPSVEARDYYKL